LDTRGGKGEKERKKRRKRVETFGGEEYNGSVKDTRSLSTLKSRLCPLGKGKKKRGIKTE